MSIQIIPKERQAKGAFNGGEIIENKPIGFPREGGITRPYSNLFYWAYAQAVTDSTIGLHPHEGFEIMSFVLKGNIRHYDTKLEEWRALRAGDAQIIRAGNGISHAEFMAKDSAMFQIWLDPDLSKTLQKPASYDDYRSADLPAALDGGVTVKTYIGKGSPFMLDTEGVGIQQFSFDTATFHQGISPEKTYSLYVLEGHFTINGEAAKTDDFIVINEATDLEITTEGTGEIFLVSSPAKPAYPTYSEMMQQRARN